MTVRHERILNMVQKVVGQDIMNKVTEYGVCSHMDCLPSPRRYTSG